MEAGRVADGEELFGVCARPVIPTHRGRNRELHVETAVACAAVTLATALDNRLCHFKTVLSRVDIALSSLLVGAAGKAGGRSTIVWFSVIRQPSTVRLSESR